MICPVCNVDRKFNAHTISFNSPKAGMKIWIEARMHVLPTSFRIRGNLDEDFRFYLLLPTWTRS